MIVLNTFFLLCELIMIVYMINQIKNCKRISLEDTIIYPFVLLLSVAVGFTAKYAYGDFDDIWLLISSVLSDSVGLVALNINTDLVKVLAEKDLFMLATYVILYFLSGLALFSLTLSLVKASVANFLRGLKPGREITYVYGFSDDAKAYFKNLSPEKRKVTCAVLERKHNQRHVDDKLFLDDLKIHYKVLPYKEKSIYRLIKRNILRKKQQYFVSFFDTEEENYSFVTKAQSILKKHDLYDKKLRFIVSATSAQSGFLKQLIVGNESKLTVQEVLGDRAEGLSEKDRKKTIKDESRGVISAYDKYELMAFKFASENNFAKYMPRQYINDNCTLKDVDVNLYMFGFGKVNQALFKDVLVINQFAKVENGLLTPVEINVKVVDSRKQGEQVFLSSGILNYDRSSLNADEYFDLPHDYRSNVTFDFQHTVGDYSSITEIVNEIRQKAQIRPQINYVIVSMGSDSFNCTFAKRFKDLVSGTEDAHTTFFVRTRESIRLNEDFVYFGDDSDALSYDNLIRDVTYGRAKKQNGMYQKLTKATAPAANESAKKERAAREEADAMLRLSWSLLSPTEQLSNIYAVASTDFKLDLMGLDKDKITAEEFYARYDPKGERLKEWVYSEVLATPSENFYIRDVFAFIEHERWNAFEMSLGVVPMKKSMMVKDGNFRNKTADELAHACITTGKGLTQYYHYVSKLNAEHGFNACADVICYDYDHMDGFSDHLDK